MAVGIRPIFQRPPWESFEGTLLENVSSSTNGFWVPILGYYPVSITVEGTFSAQVFILASNAENPPSDSFVDCPILGDPGGFQQAGMMLVNYPWKFLKAQVTNFSGGLIRGVWFMAVGPLTRGTTPL